MLCAAAAAVLAGARSLTAIGEWIADAPSRTLAACGFPADPLTGELVAPHAATIRRLLPRVDGDALDLAVGALLAARATDPDKPARPIQRAIAVAQPPESLRSGQGPAVA
jgi:hypothetical protein